MKHCNKCGKDTKNFEKTVITDPPICEKCFLKDCRPNETL